LFKKNNQPNNLVDKDTYDTFIEEIFMKEEMHKIIIFRKKSEESKMIESAVKVIND
jgi:hypothetical protein